jgi:hypothetical protein
MSFHFLGYFFHLSSLSFMVIKLLDFVVLHLGFGRVWKCSTWNYKIHGGDMSLPSRFPSDRTARIGLSERENKLLHK